MAQMAGIDRFWFHAPFAELCPAAIDPKVRQVTMERYRQAVATAQSLGICRLVIHSCLGSVRKQKRCRKCNCQKPGYCLSFHM